MQATVQGSKPKTFPMFFAPAMPSQIVHEMKGMHVELLRERRDHGTVRTAVRAADGEIWCYVQLESGVRCNINLDELDACDCGR